MAKILGNFSQFSRLAPSDLPSLTSLSRCQPSGRMWKSDQAEGAQSPINTYRRFFTSVWLLMAAVRGALRCAGSFSPGLPHLRTAATSHVEV